MAFNIPYQPIVNRLLGNEFRDIGSSFWRRINTVIGVTDDPRRAGTFLERYGRDFNVYGAIPSELVDDPKLETILTAMLAHEFSHIVRGDFGGLREINTLLRFLPWVGERIAKGVERKTDDLTIERGFGHHLLVARRYFEGYFSKNGLQYLSIYYSSANLESQVRLANEVTQ